MSGRLVLQNDGFFAHTLADRPPKEWERLEDHLLRVAKTAATFAEKFQAGDWGYLAGLWHDVGKYSPQLQACPPTERAADHQLKSAGEVILSPADARSTVSVCRLCALRIMHSGDPR